MYRFFLQTYAYLLDFLVFLSFLYLFYTQGVLSENMRKQRAAENEDEYEGDDGGDRPNYNTRQINDQLGSKYKSRILTAHNSKQPEALGKNSIYLASINDDD